MTQPITAEVSQLRTVEPVLCYVAHGTAWFTTFPLDKQWGDDWNDAPYEHNAGTPYAWSEYMRKDHPEPYTLTVLKYDAPLETPDSDCSNSRYSVEQINSGAVPWLQHDRWFRGERVRIWAGCGMYEFRQLIAKAGGKVFAEVVP